MSKPLALRVGHPCLDMGPFYEWLNGDSFPVFLVIVLLLPLSMFLISLEEIYSNISLVTLFRVIDISKNVLKNIFE